MTHAIGGPARLVLACAVPAVWAAAATASDEPGKKDAVDRAFEQLKRYDYDQPRKPLALLEQHIARAAGDPRQKRQAAERLAAVLADEKAPLAAKRFACKQLRLVGTDAQVPLLAKMLARVETAEMARQTLEGIECEASARALHEALAKLKGRTRIGLINSLGIRRVTAAVDDLERLLNGAEPEAAVAAARALGKIGTPEAAAALLKRCAKLLPRSDALACADRLAADGNAATAEGVYQRLYELGRASWLRSAALAGLVRVSPDKATPRVLEAIGSQDAAARTAALRLALRLPGAKATAALAERLDGLAPAVQAELIAVLADRGDRSAAAAVAQRIESQHAAVRAAAVQAMGVLGGAADVSRLAPLCAAREEDVGRAAREALSRLSGKGVDEALLTAAADAQPALKAELIGIIAARRSPGATDLLVAAADGSEAAPRQAALKALAVMGSPQCYGKLVRMLASADTKDGEAVLQAAAAVARRVAKRADPAAPVREVLNAAPPKAKALLLRLLAACGGPEALAAVRTHLESKNAAVREAAVRALAQWPDTSAAEDLLKLARTADSHVHRVLALRGVLRLARETADPAGRLKLLARVRELAATVEAKRMLLSALADVAEPGAMELAAGFLADPDVHAEAALAVLKAGRAIIRTHPAAVRGAMGTLIEAAKDEGVVKQARALQAQAARGRARVGRQPVPAHDPKRSDALKKELARRPPKGYALSCYLDCGPDTTDGKKGDPVLRLLRGEAYMWSGCDRVAHMRFGTIFFTGDEVVFEAAGLKPTKTYRIGFTWWDYDHDTRAQSVWASAGKSGRPVRLLAKTKLPSGAAGEKPAEITLDVPRALTAGGSLRIVFRNESQPNAVVSELWLWESQADSPPPAAPKDRKPGAGRAVSRPASIPHPRDPKATNVLIVTGIDYPGHKWRQTTPVVAAALRKDRRLRVAVVEDPHLLASPVLHEYDVIVHHWMNWKVPAPGDAAKANFRKFVRDGGGLVLLHFGCGAFQKWPEFVKIGGRVWDPKLRGHDPHGTFRVEITDTDHPITKGMNSFEITDELYTCLAGKTPITVLATARSKVDGKDYAMAFVLTYGKGRVFHTPLGHDVRAFSNAGAGELIRRGCAWAAGLPPVPPGRKAKPGK